MQVEYAVLPRDCRVTVRIDDRKLRSKIFDCVVGASEIVRAKCNYFGVARTDVLVVLCQIDELAAAERSPERPIEDQHGVTIAADL